MSGFSSDCLPDKVGLNSPIIIALRDTSRHLDRMYNRTLASAYTVVRLYMRDLRACLIVLLLTSCALPHNEPADPPTFPLAASVIRIEMGEGSRSVTDSKEIHAFVESLSSIRSDWSFTWATYPTPQESVFLIDANNRALCRVDFGPGWVGSNCGQSKDGRTPLTDTTAAQDGQFQAFVGAKWE